MTIRGHEVVPTKDQEQAYERLMDEFNVRKSALTAKAEPSMPGVLDGRRRPDDIELLYREYRDKILELFDIPLD